VFGEAFDDAIVEGDAIVYGQIHGNAHVSGHEIVFGDRDH
jgi:hypothetical protein